jgi:glycosyltransferase involved in cell wall biosynthesis
VGRFQSPSYEAEIRRLADALRLSGAVDWVGLRRDVDAELTRMDIVVLPSLAPEAMPMSVLEAMSAGVPVVGARVPGVTDLIQDGRDGLLAEPGDSGSLADALAQIIQGRVDWGALRANAFRRQAAQFTDKAMAAGVAAVYRQVLSRNHGNRPRRTLREPGHAHRNDRTKRNPLAAGRH